MIWTVQPLLLSAERPLLCGNHPQAHKAATSKKVLAPRVRLCRSLKCIQAILRRGEKPTRNSLLRTPGTRLRERFPSTWQASLEVASSSPSFHKCVSSARSAVLERRRCASGVLDKFFSRCTFRTSGTAHHVHNPRPCHVFVPLIFDDRASCVVRRASCVMRHVSFAIICHVPYMHRVVK